MSEVNRRLFLVTRPIPCCGSVEPIGLVVEGVESVARRATCVACGTVMDTTYLVLAGGTYFPRSMLIAVGVQLARDGSFRPVKDWEPIQRPPNGLDPECA